MVYEQPQSKSAGYGSFTEWEAIGEIGEIVTESWLLPELILGGFIADFFGD